MLDFGFSEILLTSVIALVVLGPERLPKVARQVGNWMGRARAMARQLSEQLDREVTAEEFLKQQNARKIAAPKSSTGAGSPPAGDSTVSAAPAAGTPAPAVTATPGSGPWSSASPAPAPTETPPSATPPND